MIADPASDVTTCYRHPQRAAALGCSRCERPICLEDAVDAPVGYLCPECARAPQRQVRAARSGAFLLTKTLVAINVVVFVLQQVPELGDVISRAGVLFGPAVANGEWWRTVSSGFLHGGLLHIGFNGYLLWMLGQMLEPETGTARFGALYAAGLFGGSAGALLLSWDAATLGASGAVFGLMGAAMVGMRRRGVDPWRSSIGSLVLLNLVFTFAVPGVSIGGHVGGLLGGAVAALPVFQAHLPTTQSRLAVPWVLAGALAAAAVWLGVAGPFL